MTRVILAAILLAPACSPVTYVNGSAPLHQPAVISQNELTPKQDVPLSGTARYSGALGVGFGEVTELNEARLVGDLDLRADFLRDEIHGRADNFTDRLTGEALTGAVAADLSIDRSADLRVEYGARGNIGGELQRPNGQKVDVDLAADGDFFGTEGARLAGDLNGAVSGLALTPDDAVIGIFDVLR